MVLSAIAHINWTKSASQHGQTLVCCMIHILGFPPEVGERGFSVLYAVMI